MESFRKLLMIFFIIGISRADGDAITDDDGDARLIHNEA